MYNFLRWHTKEVFFQGRATRRLARVFSVAAMPAAVARKTGKRSVSKAKKVKNVGLKRTKGVCTHPQAPSFRAGARRSSCFVVCRCSCWAAHERAVERRGMRPWRASDVGWQSRRSMYGTALQQGTGCSEEGFSVVVLKAGTSR